MSGGGNKRDWDTIRFSNRVHSLREISISYEGGTQVVSIRPPDVSTRGMFVNTSEKFPEGAVLNLRFCLDLSGVEVQARGEVRYCIPSVGVGIEFIAMSQKGIRAIEKEIELVRGNSPAASPPEKSNSATVCTNLHRPPFLQRFMFSSSSCNASEQSCTRVK